MNKFCPRLKVNKIIFLFQGFNFRVMKKIYLLLLLILPLISCDKKEETIIPNIMTYPMTVGSQWTYDRQIVVNRYESKTSKKIVGTDTYNFIVKVWVDKDTVLNGKQVMKFVAEDENIKHVNFNFLDSEGLKTYAYINTGLMVFADAHFHLKSAVMDQFTAQAPVFYEQAPAMNLKFPLQNGLRWTYRPSTETSSLKIEKQVTGSETLNVAGERFNCFKIDWIYSNAPSMITYK